MGLRLRLLRRVEPVLGVVEHSVLSFLWRSVARNNCFVSQSFISHSSPAFLWCWVFECRPHPRLQEFSLIVRSEVSRFMLAAERPGSYPGKATSKTLLMLLFCYCVRCKTLLFMVFRSRFTLRVGSDGLCSCTVGYGTNIRILLKEQSPI